MSVQIMQCPSCGSPLPAPAIGTITSCTYCGARLEVTKGASGSPLAKLSEIKEDTSFIAKERARDHLRHRVWELDCEIGTLQQAPTDSAEVQKAQGNAVEIGLFVAALATFSSCVLGYILESIGGETGATGTVCLCGIAAPVIGVFIGYAVYKSRQSRRVEPLRRHAAERHLEEISGLLADKISERATLADDLDRLHNELDVLARRV